MALPCGAMGWSAVCDCGISMVILTYFLMKMVVAIKIIVRIEIKKDGKDQETIQ